MIPWIMKLPSVDDVKIIAEGQSTTAYGVGRPIVATGGLCTCVSVIAYDASQKWAFVAHSSGTELMGRTKDFRPEYDPNRTNRHVSFLGTSEKRELDILIGSGISPYEEYLAATERTINQLAAENPNIIIKSMQRWDTSTTKGIPDEGEPVFGGSVGIDSRNGWIYQYCIWTDQLQRTDIRLGQ